ncbi:MAG: hypothetical protein JNJ90_21235 [Saprospiraceae bacterium]|jgi:hypothetical protein|nr:hypothetical protein [Saprospiraceae bacterium]
MYTEIEQKMSDLEMVLSEFIVQTNKSFRDLHNEMKDFKDEMKDFKDEMKDFKDEMKDFKEEMKDFKEEMRQDRREMNKQWGELANKMGTLVEDIIAPAIRPVIEKYFLEEVMYRAVNVRKKDKSKGLQGEFDIIATTSSSVFLIETKSSPKPVHLQEFQNDVIPRFRQLFPEYKDLKMVPVLASLRFEDAFLSLATQSGVYLLAYREWDYMDLLNFEALQPGSPTSKPAT